MTQYKTIDAVSYFQDRADFAAFYRKSVTVLARPAVPGESIVTLTTGNHQETTNTAKEGQMVVRNPGGEEYIIAGDVFAACYAAADDKADELPDELPLGYQTYRAVGAPLPCIELTENVTFKAPWGADTNIQEGGVLVNAGGADVYGIAPAEFRETYRPCLPDGTFL